MQNSPFGQRMKVRVYVFFLVFLAILSVPWARDITFLATSDCHYYAYEMETRNNLNRAAIVELNALPERDWPENLGNGKIGTPMGVVVLGDLVDRGDRMLEGKNQTAKEWEFFEADFGFDGRDGLLKYPVFEGFGNHDGPPVGKEKNGFSVQSKIRERNLRRKEKGLIQNVSENGMHYSWDWDGVHFVQLNIYPGTAVRPNTRSGPVVHDPQRSLEFLKEDLASQVGNPTQPVVLMHHYDLNETGSDWWLNDERDAYYEAIKDYNVVLILHGHTHREMGVYKWRDIDVINTGKTIGGFFVVRITDTRLIGSSRERNYREHEEAGGKISRKWEDSWKWNHVLSKDIGESQ